MTIVLNSEELDMIKALLEDHAYLCRDESESFEARELLSNIESQERVHDPRLPASYCEIEYDDMESEEAVMGARFDDMNYLRYMER